MEKAPAVYSFETYTICITKCRSVGLNNVNDLLNSRGVTMRCCRILLSVVYESTSTHDRATSHPQGVTLTYKTPSMLLLLYHHRSPTAAALRFATLYPPRYIIVFKMNDARDTSNRDTSHVDESANGVLEFCHGYTKTAMNLDVKGCGWRLYLLLSRHFQWKNGDVTG